MSGRFSRPVLPGEPLTVSVWRQDGSDTALFQTTKQDGTVVIDRAGCGCARDDAARRDWPVRTLPGSVTI